MSKQMMKPFIPTTAGTHGPHRHSREGGNPRIVKGGHATRPVIPAKAGIQKPRTRTP